MLAVLSCSPSRKLSVPAPAIVPRSGWNANEARPYKHHVPVRITIHHEGTRLEDTADAARKIRNIQIWGMGKDRNWTDIPYHFLVGRDGTIYEGRDPMTVGETATEYDPTGHLLINCLGNLNQQPLPDAQLKSLIDMIAYACRKYNIGYETIASHRDYSAQTTCPGENLYVHVKSGYIKEEVKKRLEAGVRL
jgi:hypothetical protein